MGGWKTEEMEVKLFKKMFGAGVLSALMFATPSHALNMDVGHTLTTDSPFHVARRNSPKC